MFFRSKEKSPLQQIALSSIYPSPYQPRRRFREESILHLADSIRRHGLLQPLCVREVLWEGKKRYELIAGERRWRAAKLLELDSLPCMVMGEVEDGESAQLSILENLQREDLNFFEEALAMEKLRKLSSLSAQQVGAALSLSESAVCNKLRLLRLPASQRELILRHGLSERHARAALRVENEEHRERLLLYAGREALTVREWEDLICAYGKDAVAVLGALAEPKEEKREKKPRPVRKPIVKDVRIFINSVDKAVKLMKDSGIALNADKRESEDFVEYSIRVPKHPA